MSIDRYTIDVDNIKYAYQNLMTITALSKDLTLPEWERDLFIFLKNWYDKTDYIVLKTSGSTGQAKEIRYAKKYMLASANSTGKYFNLQAQTRALHCLPSKYIAGKMMIVRSLVLGLKLTSQEPSSCPIVDCHYEFAAMTPMQVKNILNTHPKSLELIKYLIIGGGAVDHELSCALNALNTVQCYETFGMTETISHIAIRKINGTNKQLFFQALDGVTFSSDHDNKLIITAPHLNIDRLRTNDIVNLKNKGEFIWLGRSDNVINSGGIKIHPEEVEKEIAAHIEYPYFIAGIKDEFLGQKVILLIETEENLDQTSKNLILQKISIILSKNTCPKEIVTVPLFLYTKTNKVRRKASLQKYGLQ